LDHLSDQGALCAISTHYQKLKTYALINESAQNASVEFDTETGMPTFRLLTGMPGVSHAMAIARDAGLTDQILDRASGYLGNERQGAESVMEDLARMVEEVQREKEAVTRARQDYESSKERLEREQARLRQAIEKAMAEKEQQADTIIGEARGEFRRAIDYLKREGSRGQSKATEQYAEAKKGLLSSIQEMKAFEGGSQTQLAVGQNVFHTKSKKSGVVVSLDSDSSRARIMAGNVKLTVDSSELIPESEGPVQHKGDTRETKHWSVSSEAEANTELNLVGRTVAEAIPLVD
jgi:DNA mismatch repair protein MutS2